MDIINISGVYRFLTRHGLNISNPQVKRIVLGKVRPGTLPEDHKRRLLKLIDETMKEVKSNISKS